MLSPLLAGSNVGDAVAAGKVIYHEQCDLFLPGFAGKERVV